jgi:hypothetical protein
MSDSAELDFGLLHEISRSQGDLRLLIERLAGEQRTANVDFGGQLKLLQAQLAGVEAALTHTKGNTASQFQSMDKRMDRIEERVGSKLNDLEEDIGTLKEAKSFSAGKQAVLAAVVSFGTALIIAVLGALFRILIPGSP